MRRRSARARCCPRYRRRGASRRPHTHSSRAPGCRRRQAPVDTGGANVVLWRSANAALRREPTPLKEEITMRNFDEKTITDAVIERFSQCSDARTKQISEALVRHLHNFIREIRPTEEEWAYGIDFLTRTGQKCDDKRQEFILLSDVLGVSMLVDAINHPPMKGVTESTVFGPFYVNDPPQFKNGEDLTGKLEGEPMYVEGTVRAVDGK